MEETGENNVQKPPGKNQRVYGHGVRLLFMRGGFCVWTRGSRLGYVYCLDRGGEMSTALKLAKANSRPPVAVPVRAVDGCLSLTVAAGFLRLLSLTIRRV